MAFTSPKMGLRIWNLLTDLYDHAQLADNWAKVDYHDHSPGKGVQVPTEGLADGAVTGPKLATSLDPSGAYTSLKTVFRATGTHTGAPAAGTYLLRTSASAILAPGGTAADTAFYLDPADFAASGRTTKLVFRAALLTNATSPTGTTYSFGIFPVATWGGAAGAVPTVATIGSIVAGSATPNIVAPAATTMTGPQSVELDPPTAGWYTLGLVQTSSPPPNSSVAVFGNLFVKQV
jgi:hypothetical protein